jgi:hypothetical protein
MRVECVVALVLAGCAHSAPASHAGLAPAKEPRTPPSMSPVAAASAERDELQRLSRLFEDSRSDGWDSRRLRLTRYRRDGADLVLEGEALDSEDVASLLKRMQASRSFIDIVFERVEDSGIGRAFAIRARTLAVSTGALELSSSRPRPPVEGRDPFQAEAVPPVPPVPVAEDVALAALRVIAIVDSEEPMAMLNGNGTSYIIHVGSLVGRHEEGAGWLVEHIAGDRVLLSHTVGSLRSERSLRLASP